MLYTFICVYSRLLVTGDDRDISKKNRICIRTTTLTHNDCTIIAINKCALVTTARLRLIFLIAANAACCKQQHYVHERNETQNIFDVQGPMTMTLREPIFMKTYNGDILVAYFLLLALCGRSVVLWWMLSVSDGTPSPSMCYRCTTRRKERPKGTQRAVVTQCGAWFFFQTA
jgi:hypothetical protein